MFPRKEPSVWFYERNTSKIGVIANYLTHSLDAGASIAWQYHIVRLGLHDRSRILPASRRVQVPRHRVGGRPPEDFSGSY